jgi:hypothetical protein
LRILKLCPVTITDGTNVLIGHDLEKLKSEVQRIAQIIPIRCEGELLKGDLLAVLWLMFERNWYYCVVE